MDCPTDDNVEMVECLRTKDAKAIMATDKLFYVRYGSMYNII